MGKWLFQGMGRSPDLMGESVGSRGRVFRLDDGTEERDWCGFHGSLKGVAHALNTILASLNDAAVPCQV